MSVETVSSHDAAISVRIKFMGDMPAIVGCRNASLAMPAGATVGDLLEHLCATHGEGFRRRVFSGPGKLQHTMLIFAGGEDIKQRGGLAAPLADEVEILMLPMFGGG